MISMGFISRHAIGVLIVLVIAGWALFYVPSTPSYAIYQLKQAIDARDGATAATFVDFPSVVKNAGYEMLRENSNANDVMTAMIGKGAVDLLSAPVAAGVQQWATQQVNSGARRVQMPAAAVAGAIVLLHHSGDAAWTNFRDNKGQQWNIRMARENERWRIIEVKDIQQLLQHFEQEKRMGAPPATPPDMGASGAAPETGPPGDNTSTPP
ncbi:MAG TPA: DUF2939 domain-containing protein [Candidatus Binataceae bacterium]|nr:DUF2939 domain-containing protein [Candidatus Binataceae bacterium]